MIVVNVPLKQSMSLALIVACFCQQGTSWSVCSHVCTRSKLEYLAGVDSNKRRNIMIPFVHLMNCYIIANSPVMTIFYSSTMHVGQNSVVLKTAMWYFLRQSSEALPYGANRFRLCMAKECSLDNKVSVFVHGSRKNVAKEHFHSGVRSSRYFQTQLKPRT